MKSHSRSSLLLRGHVTHDRTVPGNMPVKFEACSCNRFGAIGIDPPKFSGSRDPGHAHLGALLCINIVVLLRHKLCENFVCSIFNGSRNNYGGIKLEVWLRDRGHDHFRDCSQNVFFRTLTLSSHMAELIRPVKFSVPVSPSSKLAHLYNVIIGGSNGLANLPRCNGTAARPCV